MMLYKCIVIFSCGTTNSVLQHKQTELHQGCVQVLKSGGYINGF